MPTFEIAGPGPEGDFSVVRTDTIGDITRYTTVPVSFATAEEAQEAANSFNADPASAPK
jgi:hypothetical protein